MSYTPGPWEVRAFPTGVGGTPPYGVIVADDRPVAEVHLVPEAQDNAHLIAAAPDLLGALLTVHEQARAYHDDCGHGQPGSAAECDGICDCLPQMREAIIKAQGAL